MNFQRCLALLAILYTISSGAQAVTLMDSTADKSATLALPASSSSLATGPKGWSFTVAGGPWTITDISFGLYANISGTSQIGVRLYSGITTTGFPAQDTGTSELLLNTIAGAQYYDWSGLSWNLAAGTYTLAVYSPGGNVTSRVATTAETMSTASGFSGVASTQSGNNYALRVTSVPEPSTSVIFALFAAGIGFVRRR